MKTTLNLSGQKVNINTDNPKVAKALVALVEACAERQFPIGLSLEHVDKDGSITEYLLARIKQYNGTHRAYLINHDTGVARNSRKVVMVQEPKGGEFGKGYVTDLPAERDKFIDPDGDGEYIDC